MSRIRVAIVDSGVNAHHSHVQSVRTGVSLQLTADGSIRSADDWRDRHGHGTAVAGAVRLFAPDCELLAINVVDDQGKSSAEQLVAAIAWAVDHGAHLINLSLGTANPEHADALQQAVAHAEGTGALVIASAPSQGPPMWPAMLPQAIGVRADARVAPDGIGFVPGQTPPWRAFGQPRPLPGPAQARNFQGSSFAAARLTGLLARQAEQTGGHDPATLRQWLKATAVALDEPKQAT
jgi:subtilisin family serine protease